MALLGGALADRMDRRRLLLLDQIALVAVAAALFVAALLGEPPVLVLYVLGGLLAGFGALQNVARTAIVPNLVAREDMPAALAINFGLFQLTMVIGPGLGGLLIAATGVEGAYAVDAVSCLAMVAALRGLGPQLPIGTAAAPARIGRSIADGLRVRAPQPGAHGVVRHRPLGDDVRHAARAVSGARGERLRRGRVRHRACCSRRCRRAPPSPR